MVFKKLHLGTAAYSSETFDEIQLNLKQYFNTLTAEQAGSGKESSGVGATGQAKEGGKPKRTRKTAVTRVSEAVKALALCHNVTPVYDDIRAGGSDDGSGVGSNQAESDQGCAAAMAAAAAGQNVKVTYQVSHLIFNLIFLFNFHLHFVG